MLQKEFPRDATLGTPGEPVRKTATSLSKTDQSNGGVGLGNKRGDDGDCKFCSL